MRTAKGAIRGRSRHKNNGKRVVRNVEGRNMSNIRGKSPKQSLASAEDITMILTHGGDSPYIDQTKITILTFRRKEWI